jgi:hypothetical protein
MSPSSAINSFFTVVSSCRSYELFFPPANRDLAIARGDVSSKLMNVGLPGNIAIPNGLNSPNGPNGPNGLRVSKADMGEIVDLEGYRTLRRRRDAEAKKVKRDVAPDNGNTEGPSAPPAVNRAGPGHSGSKGAAKTRSDDSKTD